MSGPTRATRSNGWRSGGRRTPCSGSYCARQTGPGYSNSARPGMLGLLSPLGSQLTLSSAHFPLFYAMAASLRTGQPS